MIYSYRLTQLAPINITVFEYTECINFDCVLVFVITLLTTNGCCDWSAPRKALMDLLSYFYWFGNLSHCFIPNMPEWEENCANCQKRAKKIHTCFNTDSYSNTSVAFLLSFSNNIFEFLDCHWVSLQNENYNLPLEEMTKTVCDLKSYDQDSNSN